MPTQNHAEQPRRANGQFAPTLHPAPQVAPPLPNMGAAPASQDWEFRYHLRFQNFKQKTLQETKALFRARPSQLDEEARKNLFERWIEKVSAEYNMEAPQVFWDEEADYGGGGFYSLDSHSITLSPNRPSITTLLHEFRHALQAKECGPRMVSRDIEIDARAWSLSLYYQCRPVLFERLVREGRIFHINPNAFG